MSLLSYFKPTSTENSLNSSRKEDAPPPLPRTFVSWNVNGLTNRMMSKHEWEDGFAIWVSKTMPDVICLQEVKLPAYAPKGSVKGDLSKRDRGQLRDNTKGSIEDVKLVHSKLNKPPFAAYQRYWSLSDWKYSGVLVLVRKPIKVFHSRFNLNPQEQSSVHHPDGRVVSLQFGNIHFLGTYSPNHGWEEGHWNRRDQWDSECCRFLEAKVKGTLKCDLPLLWMGDLNVAPTDMDLSHPTWFRQQVQRVNNKPVSNVPSERVGQPGCANAEREGFQRYLASGQLYDVYRELHPEGPPVALKTADTLIHEVDNNHFTWRGTPGVEDPQAGRFYAKGMRIDHVLLSTSARAMVRSVEIIGSGAERKNFWGSDHCPIMITMTSAQVRPLEGASEVSERKRR